MVTFCATFFWGGEEVGFILFQHLVTLFESIFIEILLFQIEAVFAKFDKDGDGVLSFEEFRDQNHKTFFAVTN